MIERSFVLYESLEHKLLCNLILGYYNTYYILEPAHTNVCMCKTKPADTYSATQSHSNALCYMLTALWVKYYPIETSYLNVREHVVCDETLL